MFGKVDISAGTGGTGTCYQCAKKTLMNDLFSCTTCMKNKSTTKDAESFICGTCVAKKHEGHDYHEAHAKNDDEEALQTAQACQEDTPDAGAWAFIEEDSVEAFTTAEDSVSRVVELSTTDTFGFRIKGGKDVDWSIFVVGIRPGGVADRHGGLRRGDQLIAINGINVEHESHDTAVHLLKRAQGKVKLLVRYAPKQLEDMEWELHDEIKRCFDE